jgi:deoxyribose-phosphate aldolase
MNQIRINDIDNLDYLKNLIFQNNIADFEKEINSIVIKGREDFKEKEILEKSLYLLDLTTLHNTDNKQDIEKLIENSHFNINGVEGYVAGLCIFSNLLPILNSFNINKDIKKVVVSGGFPTGQMFLNSKLTDISFAIENNADEIDIPINRGLFFENRKELERELIEIKNLINQANNVKLKVILETGELQTLKNVYDASMIAMECGADFIKTSTGKISTGADIYSSAVMMIAIRDFLKKSNNEKLIGFKAAGGLKNKEQIFAFISLFYFFISKKYCNKSSFRFGCSNLKNEIINNLKKYKNNNFVI